MDNTQNALRLAALGYYVFPLAVGRKVPLVGMNFKERATRDSEQINNWWTENPRYNIGVYTGKFGEDGGALFVVDIDVRDGKTGLASLALIELEVDLPTTPEQRTCSGGRHLIYGVDTARKGGAHVLGAGVDVRSRGGYIVSPGSVVEGVEYTWIGELRVPSPAPAALLSRIRKDVPKAKPRVGVVADSAASVQRAMEYLAGEAEPAVSGAGGNDTTYRVAAALRDLGVSREVATGLMQGAYNPRCSPPWPASELRSIVGNAYRYGENAAGSATPEADFEPVNGEGSGEGGAIERMLAAGFCGLEVDDRLERSRHQVHLIKGIMLQHTSLATMVGPPKSGKSFIATDMACCVAAGTDWHGRAVTRAPVLILTGEGMFGMPRRVKAWMKKRGKTQADMEWLHVLPLPKLDTAAGLRVTRAAIGVLQERLGVRFGLIVIDTWARAMSGDENSAKDTDVLVSALGVIHRETLAAILGIHHTGKDLAKGGRGSNALLGAVDIEYRVRRNEGVSELSALHARDQEPIEPIGFTLEPVETGVYAADDGEPIVSMVPVLCASTAARPHVTAQHGQALVALEGLIGGAGGAGGAAVSVDAWRKACKGVLSEGGAPAQRVAFWRAKAALAAAGLVVEIDGAVNVA